MHNSSKPIDLTNTNSRIIFEPVKGTGDHELTDNIVSVLGICAASGTISAIEARIRYRHLPYYVGNIVYFRDAKGKYQLGIDKDYGSR